MIYPRIDRGAYKSILLFESMPLLGSTGRFSMIMFVFTFALLSYVETASAQATPTMPYLDWGGCPFECCTYREWDALQAVAVHESRSVDSPVVFQVKAKEKINAVTGVVVTSQFGVTKVLKKIKLGYSKEGNERLLELSPGELLYTLHYLGEGFDLFWYKGKVYSDQISKSENDANDIPYAKELTVESSPKAEWWVQIKNSEGKTGWTNKTDAFENMDACG